jgi:hypothetical protein
MDFKYVLIFRMKNPWSFDDDFWARSLILWTSVVRWQHSKPAYA